MPLTTGLEDTHVLVTGGAGLIGSAVVDAFCEEGARVSVVDLLPPDRYAIDDAAREPGSLDYFQADITDEESLDDAWSEAVSTNGPVSCCVALASLDLSVLEHHGTAADMSVRQFRRTLDVNVTGTFLTARMWMQGVQEDAGKGEMSNVSLILVGSESGWLGERTNPDYAASKSAVQVGLLKSLAADAPRLYEEARVNAIAPGPVDTPRFEEECSRNPDQLYMDAQATTGLCKPVPMQAVARSILYLASDNFSSHVHGQVLNVDSGKQGKVLYTKNEASEQVWG